MCHISSHLITSHHGTSHHNTLHLIACHITNDLITLHYTTFIITCSYPILSCLVLSSYRITFHILSPLCHRMFVVLCPSPHITSTAIISYPLPMPSYDVPCASYHLISSHLILSHLISSHLISYRIHGTDIKLWCLPVRTPGASSCMRIHVLIICKMLVWNAHKPKKCLNRGLGGFPRGSGGLRGAFGPAPAAGTAIWIGLGGFQLGATSASSQKCR